MLTEDRSFWRMALKGALGELTAVHGPAFNTTRPTGNWTAGSASWSPLRIALLLSLCSLKTQVYSTFWITTGRDYAHAGENYSFRHNKAVHFRCSAKVNGVRFFLSYTETYHSHVLNIVISQMLQRSLYQCMIGHHWIWIPCVVRQNGALRLHRDTRAGYCQVPHNSN